MVLGVWLGVGGHGYDSGAGLRAELRPQILAGIWDEAGGGARNLGQTCDPRPWLEPEQRASSELGGGAEDRWEPAWWPGM